MAWTLGRRGSVSCCADARGGWQLAGRLHSCGTFKNAAANGWTAARGFVSNPKNWANMGKGLGMGALGAGVTGGLNWAGGKMGVGGSDTYGGAAYGLFADAAGGATMGARGGPLGMAIGAVGGMAIGSGDASGGRRPGHWAGDVDGDKTHQQVSAAQQAMLQRQRDRVDAMVMPAPRTLEVQATRRRRCQARKYAAAMAAADAASRRWHATTHPNEPHPHVAAAHAAHAAHAAMVVAGRQAPGRVHTDGKQFGGDAGGASGCRRRFGPGGEWRG